MEIMKGRDDKRPLVSIDRILLVALNTAMLEN